MKQASGAKETGGDDSLEMGEVKGVQLRKTRKRSKSRKRKKKRSRKKSKYSKSPQSAKAK